MPLKSRDAKGVADYIKSGKARKIVVMTGAGISTSAGIPDFRSPDTGLYANLERLNLPYAEAVFDISYFREHPEPFYHLAHELYPGKFYPTVTHCFLRLLHDKGLLHKLFTQNIDCLERAAGVPDEKIIEAHGSFATQRCIDCKTPFPDDFMKKAVAASEVPHCMTPECNGLVKPDIVFFGEPLPSTFFTAREIPGQADLCIIIGTSLSVAPFSMLPLLVRPDVPRILLNLEQVGNIGSRPEDILMLGSCNDGVDKLVDLLGWRDELEAIHASVNPEVAEKQKAEAQEPKNGKPESQSLEDKIADLNKALDNSLKISNAHIDRVRAYFSGKPSNTKDDSSKPSSTDTASQSTAPKDTQQNQPRPSQYSAPGSTPPIPQAQATAVHRPPRSKGDAKTTLDHIYGHLKKVTGCDGK